MNARLRRAVRHFAFRRGISLEQHGGTAAARELMRRMWPVTTRHPLRRFGGDGDGAYILPDDLAGIEAVISPGVSTVARFEEDMAALGMECFLIDKSVEAPPADNPRFHFTPKFLGLVDEGAFVTLDSFVEAHAPGASDLLLQMDIEGAEWAVLANVSERLLRRFRIMAIEFHELERLLYSDVHRAVLDRLLHSHHVVHLHVNNEGDIKQRGDLGFPLYLEATFLRKDRAEPTGFATRFPHPLDIVNSPTKPRLDLPASWHAPPA